MKRISWFMILAVTVALATWSGGVSGQSLDSLAIATCRADQALYRVEVAQQLTGTGTIISGEATVPAAMFPSRVVVVGVDNIGMSAQGQGAVARGYSGAQFRAVVPIGKIFLRQVTICLY
ncbi:MAG TPA: hypothetical protein VFM04_06495 [Candidatus Methylomirabilis sp.]|nr:hypothetical protein [Candidatus Methylomirabilis sp.]